MRIHTLHEALAALQSADVWTWTRGTYAKTGHLSIFHDDIPNDLRTIHEIGFACHTIRITRRSLRKYDPVKHCWNEYNPASPDTELPNRKGEKRLREFIAATAKAETGWPNPVSFSHYPQRAKA